MSAASSLSSPELLKFAEKKHSRVGPEYQAVVAAATLHNRRLAGAKNDPSRPLWICSKLPDTVVDDYLKIVRSLFPNPNHMSEERALYLLHQFNYDLDAVAVVLDVAQQCTNEKSLVAMSGHAERVRRARGEVPEVQMETDSDGGDTADSGLRKRPDPNKARINANDNDAKRNTSATGDDAEEPEEDEQDDQCFVCHDGGPLICCDSSGCTRVYHLGCIGLPAEPTGTFICPWHRCVHPNCGKFVDGTHRCILCPTAFCAAHVPASISAIQVQKYASGETTEFLCPSCAPTHDGARKGFFDRLAEICTKAGLPVPKMQARVALSGGSRRDVDLYRLYHAVATHRGGLAQIRRSGAWPAVLAELELPVADETAKASDGALSQEASAVFQLQNLYIRTLFPYEKRFYCPSATRAPGGALLLNEYVDEMVNVDSSGSKKRKQSDHKPAMGRACPAARPARNFMMRAAESTQRGVSDRAKNKEARAEKEAAQRMEREKQAERERADRAARLAARRQQNSESETDEQDGDPSN